MAFKKILVPTDYSQGSAAAVDLALDLATRLDGRVTLLHVFEIPAFSVPPDGAWIPTAQTVTTLLTAAGEHMANARGEVQARARIPVEGKTIQGTPYVEIAREAKSEGYDLIVMGTHGRTGLKHLLLGSVAERVVRIAECPVLTVRSPGR
jgi:nucleotide-binding universal stress UspA family protein